MSKEIAEYLEECIDGWQAKRILNLYCNDPEVRALQLAYQHENYIELLAAILCLGVSPVLPQVNLNHGGIHPAIKEGE